MKRLGFGVLIALAVLAATAVFLQIRTRGFWPPGFTDWETRTPDPTPQFSAEGAPETREPFAFKAARHGGRIVLGGFVSRDEARNALIGEAKQAIPDVALTDEIRVSSATQPRLEEAALFGLRQLGRLPSGTVVIRDDTIMLSGQAPDIEAYNAVAAASQAAPEGFRLDISGLIPPLVRPYTWSATSSGGAVVLAGHVPSELVRQAAAATAREMFPDRKIVERLQLASGLPQTIDFEAAARFALAQLAQLGSGSANLVDTTLSLRGEAVDRDTLADVRTALQSLPPGLQTGSVAIALGKPSPYTFRVVRKAGTLTMTGYFPDAETRSAIHQLIRQRFFGDQVADRLRAADGAPPNFLAGVSFGLENLARLASGEMAVSGTALRLNGEVLYPQTAEQMIRTVPAISIRGWTGTAEISLRSTERADAALRSPQP